MMIVWNRPARVLLVLLLTAHTTERPAAAQSGWAPEDFTAIALPLEHPQMPSVIEFRITRWSTEIEKGQFARLLQHDGPDALLAVLSDARSVGRMESPDNGPWDLRFAWQERTPDGGRRILLMTDRPIGLWEVMADSDTLDFPFSLIELRVDSDGDGDGTLSVATKITVDRSLGTIALECYDGARIRLTDVRRRQST